MPGLRLNRRTSEASTLPPHHAPGCAENIPSQHVDAAWAQQIPHGKLEGAGIGARNDRCLISRRQAQRFARQIDGKLQAFASVTRTVRTANKSVAEHIRPAARTLCEGPDEKNGRRVLFPVLGFATSDLSWRGSQGTAPRVLARGPANKKGGQNDRLSAPKQRRAAFSRA